jgi:hypothetical protein
VTQVKGHYNGLPVPNVNVVMAVAPAG